MSRLTDLIARARAKDAALGEELEKEFKELSSRKSFGLNFERHKPENVELPGRPIRKGDKVRVLPARGSTKQGDQTLWKVLKISKTSEERIAHLSQLGSEDPNLRDMQVEELVVVAEFRDYIYPGLVSTGRIDCGGTKPYHTVINGENFHVLEALTYTHRGKIDAIYIDPPYNSGAKDWKYNNNYVESDDLYRHSKWLAMVERRLLVAKGLLSPASSMLVVSIDEKEYLRLGMLLEQVFPAAKIQMVTSLINPKGIARDQEFYRVEEYIFFVFFGAAAIQKSDDPMILTGKRNDESHDEKIDSPRKVRWGNLLRSGTDAKRTDRKNQFYPIYLDSVNGKLHSIGESLLPVTKKRNTEAAPEGTIAVWPIRKDGSEGRWQVGNDRLKVLFGDGYASIGGFSGTDRVSFSYVTANLFEKIESGQILITGRNHQRVVELSYSEDFDPIENPKTMWNKTSHSASEHGSSLLRQIIPGRQFPFPKSLYAVEDTLRFVVGDKKDAIVLDFFAGSGTTAHAVMRLNRQDGGTRHSISITNNEVSAKEQLHLRKTMLRPGDYDWEQWGICDYITKPRIKAVITGQVHNGKDIEGDYNFTDKFPISDGFEENAEFFTLTYETPIAVRHNVAFKRIAPLLWMRAGSQGDRIEYIPAVGWDTVETYGVLINLDEAACFCKAVQANKNSRIAYIVTDDNRRFQAVTRSLPSFVEPVRLYESYLSNFRFLMGR